MEISLKTVAKQLKSSYKRKTAQQGRQDSHIRVCILTGHFEQFEITGSQITNTISP